MEILSPSLVTKIVELWGPFGLLALAGWFALRWLAQRDDERSAKADRLIESITAAVTNNTSVMNSVVESNRNLITSHHELMHAFQEMKATVSGCKAVQKAYNRSKRLTHILG